MSSPDSAVAPARTHAVPSAAAGTGLRAAAVPLAIAAAAFVALQGVVVWLVDLLRALPAVGALLGSHTAMLGPVLVPAFLTLLLGAGILIAAFVAARRIDAHVGTVVGGVALLLAADVTTVWLLPAAPRILGI